MARLLGFATLVSFALTFADVASVVTFRVFVALGCSRGADRATSARRLGGRPERLLYPVPMERVRLFDTTLRDGMQREGISLSVSEKLQIAHLLDGLGVHFIEAGFPASNPKEAAFFAALEAEPLRTAEVVAFGMTRRRDRTASAPSGLARRRGQAPARGLAPTIRHPPVPLG